jgi:hypothetical protein
MSTETHVFFRGKLPSKAALARAMKELGFPFSIKTATGSLEKQSGFMPMLFGRDETGVEFDVFAEHSAVEEFADAGVDQTFERRASFRWSGDFQEAVAGMCGAAALAKLVNGVVFDEAENRLLSVDEAIALARRNLQQLQPRETVSRPGTRPVDIKRYLKPLLKQRSDLVLIGRRLIIRPVRHLLRGVFLDRTSDKYQFRLFRYIEPLFTGSDGVGRDGHYFSPICEVWQPHFEPLLFECLDDIFDYVGAMETLDDFARAVAPSGKYTALCVAAFALSGQKDRAAELVDEVEKTDDGRERSWISEQRRFLARTTADICNEFHAAEALMAKTLKLGKAWEPSSFPVEITEVERIAKSAEPQFITTPWVARSPGLIEEVPDRPGEVRFATLAFQRQGRFLLFAPLTRQEAEERHQSRQDYVLATRLFSGVLLLLRHYTGWSPYDPEPPRNPAYVPRREFYLEAYGSLGRLRTEFSELFDQRGIVKMWTMSNYAPVNGRDVWYSHINIEDRKKNIYDHRRSFNGGRFLLLTDSDVSLCQFDTPPFGEFNDLWRRVETYLENEGFGRFS